MLRDVQRIFIVISAVAKSTTEFFMQQPGACFCARPVPIIRCTPYCFQAQFLKPSEIVPQSAQPCSTTSYAGSYGSNAQIQEQQLQQPTVGYVSGSSYGEHYNPMSGSQSNIANLLQPNQQQNTYQFNNEPLQYVSETTPYPASYRNELWNVDILPPIPPSPLYYDSNPVADVLTDLSNRTTSMYLSPLPATEEILEITKQTLSPPFLKTDSDFYDDILRTTTEPQYFSRIIYPSNRPYRKSYDIVKRRNRLSHRRKHAAQIAAFSAATCNSRRLGQAMFEAITGDVSESKRAITKATEMIYRGIKFDVICAQGDFSYTVHTRRYCEATRHDITCFAFR